jgi:hypothetical protein
LDAKIARNFARSSSGCDSSSASASTRALKSCHESSRLKYRSSGSVSTAVGAAVTAGGAEGTARNSSAATGLPWVELRRRVGAGVAAGDVGLRVRVLPAVARAAVSRAVDFDGTFLAAAGLAVGVFFAVSEDPLAGFRRLRGAGVLPSSVLTAPILHYVTRNCAGLGEGRMNSSARFAEAGGGVFSDTEGADVGEIIRGVDVAAQGRQRPGQGDRPGRGVQPRRAGPEAGIEGLTGGGQQQGGAGALAIGDEGPGAGGLGDGGGEIDGAQGGEVGLECTDDGVRIIGFEQGFAVTESGVEGLFGGFGDDLDAEFAQFGNGFGIGGDEQDAPDPRTRGHGGERVGGERHDQPGVALHLDGTTQPRLAVAGVFHRHDQIDVHVSIFTRKPRRPVVDWVGCPQVTGVVDRFGAGCVGRAAPGLVTTPATAAEATLPGPAGARRGRIKPRT